MTGLVTGSRKYGTPTEDSDTDLVVLVSKDDARRLITQSDTDLEDEDYIRTSFSLRFGCLNLIVCTDRKMFQTWEAGTLELFEARPVTRDKAVETLRALFEKVWEEQNTEAS